MSETERTMWAGRQFDNVTALGLGNSSLNIATWRDLDNTGNAIMNDLKSMPNDTDHA